MACKIIKRWRKVNYAHLYFEPLGGVNYAIYFSELRDKSFLDECMKSKFWKDVVLTWLQIIPKTVSTSSIIEILTQPLFMNSMVKYKHRPLFIKPFITDKIMFVLDFVKPGKIKTLNDLLIKMKKYPSLTFDYNAIYNGLPKSWVNKLSKTTLSDIEDAKRMLKSLPKCIADLLEAKNKNLRFYINNLRNTTVCSKNFWFRKFGFDMSNHFNIAFNSTKETRLRMLHFKILHNIYPTNIL